MSSRVILLCLDGFPTRHLSPELTPHLVRLAESGGRAREGGIAELPSSTYPNHATLLTGVSPSEHGVHPVRTDDGDVVPPVLRAVTQPTLIDRARGAGRSARAVVGDPELVRVLRLGTGSRADVWPPTAEAPAGTERCEHGYLRDSEVLPRLIEAVESDAALVFGQLNEPDTAGHVHGPDSEAALARYRATDEAVGAVLSAASSRWEKTVVVAVSDHDMEPVTDADPIDPESALPELIEVALYDGGAAWLWPRGGVETEVEDAVRGLEGIESCWRFGDGLLLATASPGRRFLGPVWPRGGLHGGRATQATLAVVGGGHPAARTLGELVASGRPSIAVWAPLLAAVLGVER